MKSSSSFSIATGSASAGLSILTTSPTQAIAAIERITRGNFRHLERLFHQINRVLKINQLDTITDDIVEAAASILVSGN